MKQKTILRAVLAAVLSLVATTASAHSFEVNGIYYNDNGDGTVSVLIEVVRMMNLPMNTPEMLKFHLLLPIPKRPIPLLPLAIMPSGVAAA
ncbi:MAG: hypothetical protein PUD64_09615 [Bacteroidales bacterium]|nr:hypothetical protein [Bacteroidales bacterium]